MARFFTNIGRADVLGSGVRNLYKFTKLYSGGEPEFLDGDVFTTTVPMNNGFGENVEENKAPNKARLKHVGNGECALFEESTLDYLKNHPNATQKEVADALGKTRRGVQDAIARLKEKGLLKREGARKNGRWVVMD